VGQVRCVFTLPLKTLKSWFPASTPTNLQVPYHLAYVEWFTPFTSLRPGRDHRMYKISRHMKQGMRGASVIPVLLIRQSVHLIPAFGPVAPTSWKSSSVLESAPTFYVNSFSDRFPYSTLF
jgi:hypothetical protein